jgi:L-ascorbate metabolism protein UlaG (beta-lactamase superfamily)
MLAWHLDARTVVPHHHLIWAKEKLEPEETLDPGLFEATYRKLGGKARVLLPAVGAGFVIGPEGVIL